MLPKTVFLSDDDQVTIAGFGMARLDSIRHARAAKFYGVANFMAPAPKKRTSADLEPY